jgi:hypothetical protein
LGIDFSGMISFFFAIRPGAIVAESRFRVQEALEKEMDRESEMALATITGFGRSLVDQSAAP